MPGPAIATKYTRRGDSLTRSPLPEGLDHEVVDHGPQLVSAALGHEMNPIREQHDHRFGLEVDPERRAGEAEVPDRARGEVAPGGGGPRARSVPAERPTRARGQLLAAAPLADEHPGERCAPPVPGVEPGLREGH